MSSLSRSVQQIARTFAPALGLTALLWVLPVAAMDDARIASVQDMGSAVTRPESSRPPSVIVGMYGGGWPPFEMDPGPSPSGLSVDYLSYVMKQLQLSWQVRVYDSWPELYQAACRGQVDLVMSVLPSEERRGCLYFSAPYFQTTPALISRRDSQAPQELSTLSGRKIAVVRGFTLTQLLEKKFPTATFVQASGVEDGITAVSQGRADVFITNPYTARYIIAEKKLSNLRIAATLPIPNDQLSFAAPHRNRPLVDAMSAALDSMSSLQHARLREKWAPQQASNAPTLGAQDISYLKSLGSLTVAYASTRNPISFVDPLGQANGYGPTVFRRVASSLGITANYIPVDSAQSLRELSKRQRVDVAIGFSSSDSLPTSLVPTMPYSAFPVVVTMRADAQTVSTGAGLAGLRVLMSDGSLDSASRYMDVSMLSADTIADAEQGMRAVAEGRADAYIDNLMVIDHYLQKSYAGELKIAGAPGERDPMGFLVSEQRSQLLSLINRAMESIPVSQQEGLRSQWTSLQPGEELSFQVLWRKFGTIFIAVVIGICLLVLWQLRLQREVTRRRHLQQMLAARSEFQQAVIDTSPHPLLAVDGQGAVLAVNAAYQTEFAGASVDTGPFSSLSQGNSHAIAGQEVVYNDAQGRQRIGLYWQLDFNSGGGFPGRVASLVDVTPLREAERIARVTQLRLDELTRNLPGTLYQYRREQSGETSFTYVAGNPMEIFGVSSEQLVQDPKSALECVDPQDRERLLAAVVASAEANDPLLVEFRTRVKHGTRWIRSHAIPERHLNGDTVWNGYWVDVTDKYLYEQELAEAKLHAEQAALAKGRFLAVMSHEIRTPLSGVVTLLDVLESTTLDAEQRYLLTLMSESAGTLSRVIDDVLDFSRLEEHQAQLKLAPISLQDLIEGVVSAAMAQASRDVYGKVTVDPQLATMHLADEVRVRQVVSNLVGNAVKFTHYGTVTVIVQVAESDSQFQRVEIEVQDTGIGISEQGLKHLFQPFSQASDHIHSRYGGTGLGLAISRHLAQLMGGDLRLSSAEGQGTTATVSLRLQITNPSSQGRDLSGLTFATSSNTPPEQVVASALAGLGARQVINSEADDCAEIILIDERFNSPVSSGRPLIVSGERLTTGYEVSPQGVRISINPLARRALLAAVERVYALSIVAAAEDAEGDPSPQRQVRPSSRGGHILVVEDHPINQELISRQLTILGYTCDVVGGGQQALDALHEPMQYRLVITDCQMEPLSGYDWVRAFRKRESEGQHLPVIALSATPASMGDQWQQAGMDAYIERPVRTEQLKQVLAQWCPQETLPPRHKDHSVADSAELPLKELPEVDHTLLLQLITSTRSDLNRIKAISFPDMAKTLATWLHSTIGAMRILGHSDLTRTAAALEAELSSNPRLDTIAEAADLLSMLEDWLEEMEEAMQADE